MKRLRKTISKIKKNYNRRKHHSAIKNAANGIKYTIETQQNFFIHVILFCLSLIGGVVYKISGLEFMLIFLVSGIVFTLEIINTGIEALSDEVCKGKYNKNIKIAKDAASGAVLVGALFSLVVALYIFVPKILLVFGPY